jgi:signal transduction histidine kinase/CheY-like chemotaxis protein
MKKPSEPGDAREELRQSIIGLGERSIRKSYYPELQQRIAELEQRNRELQQEIAERIAAQNSARKLSRQLQQSQKMEAIGTLAGGIAHDFNNILTVIIGYTELAKLHSDSLCKHSPCPAGKELDQVLRAADRAKELVRQILTFSRRQDGEKVPLKLLPILQESLELLRASLPQSIEIKTKITCGNIRLLANAVQLQQILMNLGTNAHHAMRETGGILAVEAECIELEEFDEKSKHLLLAPGRYLLLKVCDNGCGMERALLDKIFDPYFTTKPPDQGTGMGLAVVHGVVKSHGGHISVYSEPGKGTSFLIYLPMLEEKGETVSEELPEELRGGDERILVVDDEPQVAEMQARLLASLGYRVIHDSQPLHAMERFRDAPQDFDLIITDMTMPKMNGANLAQEVMRIRPDMPVILCTGFSELVNEDKARSLGIKAFAMKPLARKSIAALIRRVLEEG